MNRRVDTAETADWTFYGDKEKRKAVEASAAAAARRFHLPREDVTQELLMHVAVRPEYANQENMNGFRSFTKLRAADVCKSMTAASSPETPVDEFYDDAAPADIADGPYVPPRNITYDRKDLSRLMQWRYHGGPWRPETFPAPGMPVTGGNPAHGNVGLTELADLDRAINVCENLPGFGVEFIAYYGYEWTPKEIAWAMQEDVADVTYIIEDSTQLVLDAMNGFRG